MTTKNIVDETNKFVMTIKELMPVPRKDYVVGGAINLSSLKADMTAINKHIEACNILKDLVDDMSCTIEGCVDEHTKAKKKIAEDLSPIGKFTAKKAQTIEPITTGGAHIKYLTDDVEPTRTIISQSGDARSTLTAIHVDHPDKVVGDGRLYFIKSLNRFAFRLNGHLLMGNIGEVYTHGCAPQKIKPCSNGRHCRDATCTYYHADNGDIRNFISGSFSYQRRTDGFSRKIGNRSTLATDIAKATKPEIDLYQDQSIHDLLCHLVILETQR